MSVVVSTGATDRVKAAAADLAVYLGRITATDFAVETGDGATGVAVGLPGDFPSASLHAELAVGGIADREAYILRTHAGGVFIIGATETAVEDAVWDLLYRIGYRQFFPGPTWEVVPTTPELSLALNVYERPDYYSRRIWYGFGAWDYAKEPYKQWCLRNRAWGGFQLSTGHAYDRFISRNKTAFEEHPEYCGLVKGERKSSKICIGNPDLRQLIVDYAVRQFDENPDADSISVDPSDGGGWCECERCAALGSVTDRALTLANEVATAINKKHRDKYVGMYAYSFHSPPPSLPVHPNVIISVATAFIRGGYTLDELIGGWSKKGATLGIREYYSVNTWSRNMPGKARGGNLGYLTRTIPDFHAKGARFLSAESGDCWGPNGLGYYLASRMMWDVDEVGHVDTLVDDFLSRAFGPATEPMRAFYEAIDGSNPLLVFDDQLGRMFRTLKAARDLADSPGIHARLDDLVLYSRYVELFDEYRNAQGDARQPAFETLIRYTYRMRRTMMVHALALYRDLVNRDKNVSIPEGAEWSVVEEKNPWKSSEPFTEEELADYVANGIASHELVNLDFEAETYSDDLVPVAALELPDVEPGTIGAGRGKRSFYTYVENAPATIELKITGGLIAHYRDRGNVKIQLWKIGGESETGERETLTTEDQSVPPDGEERTVELPVQLNGLYRLDIADGSDLTLVDWDDGTPMTLVSTVEQPARIGGRWHLYFYVPKGTPVVGLFADGDGRMRNADGKELLAFDSRKANFYSVPVEPGQDGRLWSFHFSAGTRRLMTVPPCLARNPRELLLPREVVEADRPQK